MQNFALKLFPRERVKYKLFIRKPRNFALFGDTTSRTFVRKLSEEIDQMRELYLKEAEYAFLQTKCTYFDRVYLDFLKNYRYDPTEVTVGAIGEDGIMLEIEGYWHRTILWEVPLMATISELFFQEMPFPCRDILEAINIKKAKNLSNNGLKFVDMGTRRRHSFQNQQIVIEDFLSIPGIRSQFLGTSNPYFAMTYDLPVIGTKAHELYSLMAAIYGFIYANTVAMEKWYEVYNGKLGIVLPDTFTTDTFLHSFTYKWAKLFDGPRQDSGNPIDFATKFMHHYSELGIQHQSKIMLFSDSLNDEKAIRIQQQLTAMGRNSDINYYCIGTYFSHDIPGLEPLNMVIKLVSRLYGGLEIPAIKLSDDYGKNTGDPSMVKICRDTFSAYRQDLHMGLTLC
jgi:nicotinate phosphoribosyltransferase